MKGGKVSEKFVKSYLYNRQFSGVQSISANEKNRRKCSVIYANRYGNINLTQHTLRNEKKKWTDFHGHDSKTEKMYNKLVFSNK